MATEPLRPEPTFDVREQAVRIDQKLATAMNVKPEIRFAPWRIVTTAPGAGAALVAARAAFTKLLIG